MAKMDSCFACRPEYESAGRGPLEMMNNVDPMSQPLVSVCLPNRNTLPYLPERVDTIFGQTYKNWELIVSDNFSEDGAWAFFEGLARKDSRVSIARRPWESMTAGMIASSVLAANISILRLVTTPWRQNASRS